MWGECSRVTRFARRTTEGQESWRQIWVVEWESSNSLLQFQEPVALPYDILPEKVSEGRRACGRMCIGARASYEQHSLKKNERI